MAYASLFSRLCLLPALLVACCSALEEPRETRFIRRQTEQTNFLEVTPEELQEVKHLSQAAKVEEMERLITEMKEMSKLPIFKDVITESATAGKTKGIATVAVSHLGAALPSKDALPSAATKPKLAASASLDAEGHVSANHQYPQQIAGNAGMGPAPTGPTSASVQAPIPTGTATASVATGGGVTGAETKTVSNTKSTVPATDPAPAPPPAVGASALGLLLPLLITVLIFAIIFFVAAVVFVWMKKNSIIGGSRSGSLAERQGSQTRDANSSGSYSSRYRTSLMGSRNGRPAPRPPGTDSEGLSPTDREHTENGGTGESSYKARSSQRNRRNGASPPREEAAPPEEGNPKSAYAERRTQMLARQSTNPGKTASEGSDGGAISAGGDRTSYRDRRSASRTRSNSLVMTNSAMNAGQAV